MQKFLKYFVRFIVLAVIVVLVVVIFDQIVKQLQYERCLSLKDQNGQQLVNFYITKDEKEMCDKLNITVNAPVYEIDGYQIYDR